jgi:shikimate kinase
MAVREPLYRATAHLIVSTDRRKVAAVAEAIIDGLAGLDSGVG